MQLTMEKFDVQTKKKSALAERWDKATSKPEDTATRTRIAVDSLNERLDEVRGDTCPPPPLVPLYPMLLLST